MTNENLAYWIGVAQSDGCFKVYFDKKKGVISHLISFNIGRKSLPMLERFQRLSAELFERKAKIFKIPDKNIWAFHIGVKELFQDFIKSDIFFGDPPKAPKWTLSDDSFFGAYLAGLIDGDGDIRIKRKKYPQCIIRITNSTRQGDLQKAVSEILVCKVGITQRRQEKRLGDKEFIGKSFELEFCVSKKNHEFIKRYIVPHITLDYKKNKLLQFIGSKWPD